jgi:hypothetical protein
MMNNMGKLGATEQATGLSPEWSSQFMAHGSQKIAFDLYLIE